MIDPRLAVVSNRLSGVDRILAVTGGKGGIGKSLIASLLALSLARRNKSVGLLDLDFTGPCAHLMLGIRDRFPAEEFGVEPPLRHGVRFMSVSIFAGDSPAPLRGVDVSNALLELLAITRWGELDALVIDMPPGLGDAALDAVRLVDRASYVVVATSSRVVVETVRRNLELLGELRVGVAGVVENMQRSPGDAVAGLARRFDVPLLGAVPYDPALEDAIGEPDRLGKTAAFEAVARVADRLAP